MAEKIAKTYTVAGKTFATYAEAVAHRKANATSSIRKQVECALDREDIGRGESEEILDVLFQHFDIKPKKAAQ
jgi:hypothetical protein